MCEVSGSTGQLAPPGFKIMVIGHKPVLCWHAKSLLCVLVTCQCMCFLMHGLKVCRTCHLTQWKAQLTASRLSFKCPCPCRCPHHHGLSGLQAVPQQGILEGFTVDLLEHSNWCIQLLQKVHEVCFNGHCIAT